MLASPPLVVRVACRAGLPARLVEPVTPRVSLGAKGRWPQLATWKGDVRFALSALVAGHLCPDREGVAVGRVEGEVLSVEVDADRAQAQRDAFKDLGQRVRDGRDLSGFRVDVDRRPNDNVAEVVRARDSGCDHGERERRALIGSSQVNLARNVDGVVPRSGARQRGADLGGGGAAGVGFLF